LKENCPDQVVQCTISLKAKIWLNTARDSYLHLGSYGHEQLHVGNLGTLLDGLTVEAGKCEAKYGCRWDCRTVAASLTVRLKQKISYMINWEGQHANFDHPQPAVRYRPLSGTTVAPLPQDLGDPNIAPSPSANARKVVNYTLTDLCP
jgi:hypothetical protein